MGSIHDPMTGLRARAGDPVSMGDVVAPECETPAVITWPSTVEALIRRVDPLMRSTDASVAACTTLDRSEKQDWSDFYESWRASAGRPVDIFGTGARWDETCGFSRELSARRDELARKCAILGPANIPKADKLDLSPVKWVAAGVVVVGVAWTVRSIVLAVK